MTPTLFYALDFDGVICDSAVETAMTGWKAASKIWNDFATAQPPQPLIDQFRLIRPLMETGYEAILIMRLLHQRESVADIFKHYSEKKQQIIESSKINITDLKQLFGATRDNWIDESAEEWIRMNPLFPGMANKLQRLNAQTEWAIITTKQERFVMQILDAHQIMLAPENIFGLERQMSKEAVLIELLAQYPQHLFHFVEDRLPTLLTISNHTQLQNIQLFLATWGYNTETDKQQARQQARIQLINRQDFLG
jgi:phosphoglycolate phosphatase-like HAD superfamily hydrolase